MSKEIKVGLLALGVIGLLNLVKGFFVKDETKSYPPLTDEESRVTLTPDAPTHDNDVYKTVIVQTAGKRTTIANLFYSETMQLIGSSIFGFVGELQVWEKQITFALYVGSDMDKFELAASFIRENVHMLWDDYEVQAVNF